MVQGLVLIGGGTGFIGGALGRALKTKGHTIKIVSRKAGPSHMTWTDIESNGLPDNCTAVVNMAGQNVFDARKKWSEGFKQDVYASRVRTTAVLAKAISDATSKPKVFITMSGVGYYAPSETAEYTEESSGGNFDFLSNLTTDWEKSAQLPASCSNVRVVTIRSGVVLGRQGGIIKETYLPFFVGLGGPVGSGKQYFPWIHISDMVRLIMFSMDNDQVKGVLNGVSPQIITNKEFAKAFGRALWRPALFPLPIFVLNTLFSPERAKIMTEGKKVLPKRVQEYGFTYNYPTIQSACKECAKLIYSKD